MFQKTTWETVKAFFDAMKFPLLIAVVMLLYHYPQKIHEFIDKAGFRVARANIAGVEFVEKAELAAADLGGTAQKLQQVSDGVAKRDEILRQVADLIEDPVLRERVDTLVKEGATLIAGAQETAAIAATTQATIIAAAVQAPAAAGPTEPVTAPAAAPASAPISDYLIVFGADPQIAGAEYEMARVARKVPGVSLALFRKGSFYRSAVVFDDNAAREAALDKVRAAAGRGVEVVNRDSWCPAATPAPDAPVDVPVYQCSSSG
jgi:hypothetical protein